MNVMCKRDPQIVRAFLGLTPDNLTLNKADILMKKPSTLKLVDPNNIDNYISAVENYSSALAGVDSLGYGARSDYASTETSSRENALNNANNNKKDYLAQSKVCLIEARNSLAYIVESLNL